MAIEKFAGLYTPTCDICGNELTAEFDFYDAVEAKKNNGWKSRKVDGEWIDVCTDCLDQESETKNRREPNQ